jgi:hypothetical protein
VLSVVGLEKGMGGGVPYVCVPSFELSSELVEVGALARNQRNVISSLGKEASDGAQRKVNNHSSCIVAEGNIRRGTSWTRRVRNTGDNNDGTSGHYS